MKKERGGSFETLVLTCICDFNALGFYTLWDWRQVFLLITIICVELGGQSLTIWSIDGGPATKNILTRHFKA